MKKFFSIFSVAFVAFFSSTLNAQTVNDAINYNPNKSFFTAEVLDAIIKTAEVAETLGSLPRDITEMSMADIAVLGQTSFRKIATKIEATGYIQTGEENDVRLIGHTDVIKVGLSSLKETGRKIPVMQQTEQYVLTRELAEFFSNKTTLDFWKDFPETKGVTNFNYSIEAAISLNESMADVILKSADAVKYGLENVRDAFVASKFPVNATEIANKELVVLDALKTLKSTLETIPVSRKHTIIIPVRYQ